jgi:release factor glutamine methyltransferase
VSSIRDILVDAERRLSNAGIDTASVESAELMAYVLDTNRNHLLLQDSIDEEDRIVFERLMAKRLNRVPLQHLTGRAPFRHIELEVGPGVFIPRPETELVTEGAIRHLRNCTNPRAFDLCAGSGAIAISLAYEVPGTRVTAVELSPEAITYLNRNIAAVETQVPIDVVEADAMDYMHEAIKLAAGTCDVVTCNPPYIPMDMVPRDPEVRDHEPELALYGGADGLDVVRGIVVTAGMLLKSGGLLVVEHADVQGPEAPHGGVVEVIRGSGVPDGRSEFISGVAGSPMFHTVEDRQDFNQLPRFTMAIRV